MWQEEHSQEWTERPTPYYRRPTWRGGSRHERGTFLPRELWRLESSRPCYMQDHPWSVSPPSARMPSTRAHRACTCAARPPRRRGAAEDAAPKAFSSHCEPCRAATRTLPRLAATWNCVAGQKRVPSRGRVFRRAWRPCFPRTDCELVCTKVV